MKKAILLTLLIGGAAYAQTILKIGTSGYVTVNNQNYKRGDLMSLYNFTDSTMRILYTNTRTPLTAAYSKTGVINGDSSFVAFPSMDSVRKWMNAHFEYVGN